MQEESWVERCSVWLLIHGCLTYAQFSQSYTRCTDKYVFLNLHNCCSTLWNSKILIELGNGCTHACNWPLWPYKPCKGNMMRNIFRNIFRTLKERYVGFCFCFFSIHSYWCVLQTLKGGPLYIYRTMQNTYFSQESQVCSFPQVRGQNKQEKKNQIHVSTHSLPSLPPLFCW